MSQYDNTGTIKLAYDISRSHEVQHDPAKRLRGGYIGTAVRKLHRWITCRDITDEHQRSLERLVGYKPK